MNYQKRLIRNMIKGLIIGLIFSVLMLIVFSSRNTYQSTNRFNFLAVPWVMIWSSLLAFGGTRPYPTDKKKILKILLSASISIFIFNYIYLILLFPSAFRVPSEWDFINNIVMMLVLVIPMIFFALYQYLSPIKKESNIKEAGLEKDEISAEEILQNPKVKQFYENTMKAWAAGILDDINKVLKREGKLSYQKFIKLYKPKKYNALYIFFSQFKPIDDEFLWGFGEYDYGTNRAWFIFTNKRLIQREGVDNTFKEIILSEVDEYKINPEDEIPLSFKMKSGDFIEFKSVKLYVSEEYLNKAIKEFQ